MAIDRLVFFESRSRGESTLIEALFIDDGVPIFFEAFLPFEERSFKANISSEDEDKGEEHTAEDLLDACWCAGCMTPENETRTDEVQALIDRCTFRSSESNWNY